MMKTPWTTIQVRFFRLDDPSPAPLIGLREPLAFLLSARCLEVTAYPPGSHSYGNDGRSEIEAMKP